MILSIPKASLLEVAINTHNIKQLASLLTELRQQTFYHLLYREQGEWKERKRIDRRGNYVLSCVLSHKQILVERPTTQQGNYNILRSTREIRGGAEEGGRERVFVEYVHGGASKRGGADGPCRPHPGQRLGS